MFQNYTFKKQDFKAIEKAISMAYDEKLKQVFPRGLDNFDLVSYDSKLIYLWSRNNYPNLKKLKDSVCQFKIYRFPHNRKLERRDFEWMGLATGDFELGGKPFKKIPQEISVQTAPFTAYWSLIRKKHKIPKEDWPFERVYYPIIILHEIAHFYFYTKCDYTTPAQRNLLTLAKSFVESAEGIKPLSEKKYAELLRPQDTRALGELFSTLVELEATKVFYPKFSKKNFKQMAKFTAKRIKNEEVGKIEVAINANLYGRILAPYIFKRFPNWSEELHKLI